jgi:hypothetical protein
MIDVFSFTLGLTIGTVVTFIFAWQAIKTYKGLYEISEVRCNRIYDRLLDTRTSPGYNREDIREHGGIGRHEGFKTPCHYRRAGSIPAAPTTFSTEEAK